MTKRTKTIDSQLETEAAVIIGRIVLLLSRLEFNIGLYLRNAVSDRDPEAADPLIARLTFKGKLDSLLEVVEHRFAKNDLCLSEFRKWHSAMDKYRTKRNSFVHGRWGISEHEQKLINISPSQTKSQPSKETRYNIKELENEFLGLEAVANLFAQLTSKWRL